MAKGYAQTNDIDYDKTFALVPNMTIVHVVLAIVVAKGCNLHQMDVKNTFPQGNLEEYVYMVQLLGFQSALNKSAVYQLKKSLYGLEQTPRASNA